MRSSIFFALLASAIAIVIVVYLAPAIGLGSNEDFILWKLFGLPRSQVISYPAAVAFLLCVYQVLSIEVPASSPTIAKRSQWKRITKEFYETLQSFLQPTTSTNDRALLNVMAIGLTFAAAFFIFNWNDIGFFESANDQRSLQAMVDDNAEWHTPLFSLAGTLLYQFGIQLPLKTQLLPLHGLSQLFPKPHHIMASVTLMFFAMGLLFWTVGRAMGLRPIPRVFFAGAVALITTVPVGLDIYIWIFPPNFFTTQFVAALHWQEAFILAFTAILAFYWLGQCTTTMRNACAGAIFVSGCATAVLSYPLDIIYFAPMIAFYCIGLSLTSSRQSELAWKLGIGALVIIATIALRVPKFVIGMYGYTVGSYFVDHLRLPTSELIKLNFMLLARGFDFRALIVYLISFAALIAAAVKGYGALRRFAIAALVFEVGSMIIGLVNAFFVRLPLSGSYSEIAHSPLWVSYFILSFIVLCVLVDRRLSLVFARWPLPLGNWLLARRKTAYSLLAIIAVLSSLFLNAKRNPTYTTFRQIPTIQMIENEVELKPHQAYRGTVFTLVRLNNANQQADNQVSIMDDYRQYFGTDFLLDLPLVNVPILYEHEHWNSPIRLAFLRAFFGRPEDKFTKSSFFLQNYDPKIARLIGVRIVITNDTSFSDGTLVQRVRVGDTALGVFRISGINLGQYSPTNPITATSASNTIATLRSKSFDPERDVVVETSIDSALVPASSVSIVTEFGPTLLIEASSPGRSLLVLPFEFSHCLKIQALEGAGANLIPVNLVQTGLLFEKKVRTAVTYRYGLFDDLQCRAEDVARADRLRLREIVQVTK